MGLFSGMGEAKVHNGGVYFEPGLYKVQIVKVTTVRSQKARKDYFVIECKILESDNPKRRPGTTASQVIDIGNVMGPVNIKGFLAAANGIDPSDEAAVEAALGCEFDARGNVVQDKAEEAAEFAVSDENPLEGLILDLECAEIMTKTGRPFTKHTWRPSEELLAELSSGGPAGGSGIPF